MDLFRDPNQRKEAFILPDNDYIMTLLNLTADQICSYQSVRTDKGFKVTFKLIDHHPQCPYCGGKTTPHGFKDKTINLGDFNGNLITGIWKRRRYICEDCHRTFSEENHLTIPHTSESLEVTNLIMKDLSNLHKTYQDIAQERHVSPTTVQRYCDSFLTVPVLHLPESLGIDEVNSSLSRYGASYLCTMVDNKNRDLQEILRSRSQKELKNFFMNISKKECEEVRFVTMDHWETYRVIAHEFLPNACVALDPFHCVKDLTDSFTHFRVQIMNQYFKDGASYHLLKRYARLLTTDHYNPDKLVYDTYYHTHLSLAEILDLILKINENLTLAYSLKEQYRDFNSNATEENAAEKLNDVLDNFKAANLPCYETFLTTAEDWKDEIIASFSRDQNNHKETNSLAEYMNRQIRDYITISNGITNFDRFRARTLYALNKRVTYTLTGKLSTKKVHKNKRGKYNKHHND